jgi:hypothetical protein
LADVDDELDELHASSVAEFASGRMALPVVMAMTPYLAEPREGQHQRLTADTDRTPRGNTAARAAWPRAPSRARGTRPVCGYV